MPFWSMVKIVDDFYRDSGRASSALGPCTAPRLEKILKAWYYYVVPHHYLHDLLYFHVRPRPKADYEMAPRLIKPLSLENTISSKVPWQRKSWISPTTNGLT